MKNQMDMKTKFRYSSHASFRIFNRIIPLDIEQSKDMSLRDTKYQTFLIFGKAATYGITEQGEIKTLFNPGGASEYLQKLRETSDRYRELQPNDKVALDNMIYKCLLPN